MSCCNNDCRQGRDCPARERFINLGLSLAGYAALIGAGLGESGELGLCHSASFTRQPQPV